MFVKVLCLVALFTSQCVVAQEEEQEDPPAIGAIFYEDELETLRAALEIGASKFNFQNSVKSVPQRGDILKISELVCELASEGVIGIIDGLGGKASENVQALCDMLELPHVLVQHNDLHAKNWSVINMFPSGEAFNNVLIDLISIKGWTNFTILYVKGHSLSRVNAVMELRNNTDIIAVRELSGDDYRDVLLDCKKYGYVNFVVDCPSENLELLLTHAQEVDLMTDGYSYIFVSPDLFSLDLSNFSYGGVNITGFRFPDLTMTELPMTNEELWDFVDIINNKTQDQKRADEIKIKTLLVYDAVQVFDAGIKSLKQSMGGEIRGEQISCENYDSWSFGATLLNFMKTNKIENGALTRSLIFDGMGQRNDIILDYLELTPAGNQSIGTWRYNATVMKRPFVPTIEDFGEENLMRNQTFKILIAIVPPYAYHKKSKDELEGNDRYEGFAIDLIARIAEILGFKYIFEEEGNYGKFKDGKWDGMVAKIRDNYAQFAICDFTITKERKEGVDFSTPFMTLGIGILYKQPSKQPPEMFSFMAVFSREVWLYMMFVQMGVGVVMIIVGRISHKEWQNPVPCVEQPEELNNQFSFGNSIWLIIGSVMQQGSEIAPIALGPRIITSAWWFFTMVIVASYVGTLVAFLTVEAEVQPFQNVEDLYKSPIAYGAKSTGSTMTFFEKNTDKTLKLMYQKMIRNHWDVSSNNAGAEKAEAENYAFFTESTSIEFYTERKCDLMQVGDLLDSKSYGIAMQRDSVYKKFIDRALLILKEKDEIRKIKDLWWKEKDGGGKCVDKQQEDQKQLELKNLIGAFVVLGTGCLFGLLISIGDMLWGVFKRSVKYNTSFKYELIEELKFALKFSGDVKPVKRPANTDEDSSEAFADKEKEEAKDDLGSLRSAKTFRSRRSTSTNKSCHSHSSKHSANSIAVALARRRKYD